MANTREENVNELAGELRAALRRGRIGTFVMTITGEQDLDEHDNERSTPAGSVGRITHHNHEDDNYVQAWDVVFPNGTWVVLDDNELCDPRQYRTATLAEVAEWAGLHYGRMFSAQSAAAQTELAERYFELHDPEDGRIIPVTAVSQTKPVQWWTPGADAMRDAAAQPATDDATAQLRADIGRLREAGRAVLDAFGNCGSPAQQQAADWLKSLIEQTAYVDEHQDGDEPVAFG